MSISKAQRDKLPASEFGDPAHRKYPVDTEEHAKAAVSLSGMHGASPEVRTRIARLAKERGVNSSYKKKGK